MAKRSDGFSDETLLALCVSRKKKQMIIKGYYQEPLPRKSYALALFGLGGGKMALHEGFC